MWLVILNSRIEARKGPNQIKLTWGYFAQNSLLDSLFLVNLRFSPFFFPPFLATSLLRFLLNFLSPPLQFWQLGCHNYFFTSLLRALHLGSKNFSNLITKIQIFSHSSHHIISLSFLILFVRILATVLMGPTNSLAQMTSSSTFVHLAPTWTNASESLIRSFNASNGYQLVVKPLEAHQNPH